MMTGRDLIIYILENGLEDEPVFKAKEGHSELLGFITMSEAAAKMNVGTATIQTWVDLGWIEALPMYGLYIPATAKRPELEPRKD